LADSGGLVRVAVARNLAEAEFIQALLKEEGIPSLLRRTAGFDVPDFLSAGPRDVLVSTATTLDAREVLLQAELISDDEPAPRGQIAPLRLLLGILIALALGALVVWLISLAVGGTARGQAGQVRTPGTFGVGQRPASKGLAQSSRRTPGVELRGQVDRGLLALLGRQQVDDRAAEQRGVLHGWWEAGSRALA
jgi:hypothetical protein